jgi:hypothetical protein
MRIEVTEKMVEAGELMASMLTSASVSWTMNGLGGSLPWSKFLTTHEGYDNLDLVKHYIGVNYEGATSVCMTSVEAIYTAMERERIRR